MSRQIGIPAKRQLATVGLSVLFVVSWSSGFIGAKLGASDAPATTVLMWRFVPLALLLAPFWLLRSRTRERMGARELGWQALIGVLSQSGYLLTVYWAIELGVSTGTTALIDGIQPLVVAALVGPLLGAVVSGRQWIGLVVGLLGVVLVTWADATAPSTSAELWSYLVPFVGMLCLVAATLIERRRQAPPAPMRALAIHCTTSAVIFTVLAFATGTATIPASWSFWISMAWLIVLPTFGGYGLYWYLLQRIGVTRVNTLMFLVPPVTALWGAAMFAEPFTLVTAIGLALALTATWMVTAGERRTVPGDREGAATRQDSRVR